jgi:hypothetical protein
VTHVPRGHATATHAIPPVQQPLPAHPTALSHRSLSWIDPTVTNPTGADPVLGPDGEAWLPSDSFHTYDGPTVFGTDTDWTNETPASQNQPVDPVTSPPLLNSDAEITQLPLGLLDSPPHPVHEPADTDAVITAIQRLCSTTVSVGQGHGGRPFAPHWGGVGRPTD